MDLLGTGARLLTVLVLSTCLDCVDPPKISQGTELLSYSVPQLDSADNRHLDIQEILRTETQRRKVTDPRSNKIGGKARKGIQIFCLPIL